jgi:predicted nucleic acid-binding protein
MVIDTGIFIEHLRAKDKLHTTLYLLPENIDLFVSSVSMYELYMGTITKEKENDVRIITEDLQILPFIEGINYLFYIRIFRKRIIQFT